MNFIDITAADQMTLEHKNFELETFDKVKEVTRGNNLIDKEIILGIRPEDLENSAFAANSKLSDTRTVLVEVTEPKGSEIYAYIGIDGTLMIARIYPRSQGANGENLSLYIDLEKIHLFLKEDEKSYT